MTTALHSITGHSFVIEVSSISVSVGVGVGVSVHAVHGMEHTHSPCEAPLRQRACEGSVLRGGDPGG
jgi:hypothetical protein